MAAHSTATQPETSPVQAPPRTEVISTRLQRKLGNKRVLSGIGANAERLVGIAIIAVLTVAFIVIPIFSQDPNALVAMPNSAPSAANWFGTDWLGRDLFSRIFHAGRIDLTIVVVGVGTCLLLGTLIGLLVSVAPKFVRAVLMRVIDAFLAIPFIVIVVVLVNVMSHKQVLPFVPPSVGALVVSIGIVGWAPYALLTVGQALSLREREHVVAAKLLGYSPLRILVRHVAPSVMGVNLSYAASASVGMIGLIASLAFLGAGVQEPTPDLGAMMAGGLQLMPIAPWITLIPGMVVLLLGVGFALIADSNRK